MPTCVISVPEVLNVTDIHTDGRHSVA